MPDDGQELAHRFATTGIDRFDHPAVTSRDGLTAVVGAVAWLDCRVLDKIPAGDHHIVLAEPIRGGPTGHPRRAPLIYHDRRYTRVDSAAPGRP